MKNLKLALYILAVLWLIVLSQIVIDNIYINDKNIISAFSKSEAQISISSLSIVADYNDLDLEEQLKLLYKICDNISFNHEEEPIKLQKDNFRILRYFNDGKNAKTELKVVSNLENNKVYLIINMDIYKQLDSIIYYKDLIEKIIKKTKYSDYQTTIKLNGTYNGQLTKKEQKEEAKKMFESLHASTKQEFLSDDLYNIYGYTNMIKEFIVTNNKKINVNIMMKYDKKNDLTNVYLATPLIDNE